MYTLYNLPDACPLATQVILHELNQPVTLIDKQQVKDFHSINPVGTVPVLIENKVTYTEGAAVILHLLKKHPSHLFPESGAAQQKAIENIMFANATMHPAYGRLFFIAGNLTDSPIKTEAYEAAAGAINHLWQVVEDQLKNQPFLGGDQPSAADIMLTVYSRWGASFPVNIQIGNNAQTMINAILNRPSFQTALENERLQAVANNTEENHELSCQV